jgi:hypothetical protein
VAIGERKIKCGGGCGITVLQYNQKSLDYRLEKTKPMSLAEVVVLVT